MGQETKIGLQPYAQCAMCCKTGSFEFHHIIPKRLSVTTGSAVTNLFVLKSKNTQEKIVVKIPPEEICIKVCRDCHKRLHPENKIYNDKNGQD